MRLASRGAARPAPLGGVLGGYTSNNKGDDRGTLYCSSGSENYRVSSGYQRPVVLEMALRAFSRTIKKRLVVLVAPLLEQ